MKIWNRKAFTSQNFEKFFKKSLHGLVLTHTRKIHQFTETNVAVISLETISLTKKDYRRVNAAGAANQQKSGFQIDAR